MALSGCSGNSLVLVVLLYVDCSFYLFRLHLQTMLVFTICCIQALPIPSKLDSLCLSVIQGELSILVIINIWIVMSTLHHTTQPNWGCVEFRPHHQNLLVGLSCPVSFYKSFTIYCHTRPCGKNLWVRAREGIIFNHSNYPHQSLMFY